MVWFIKFSRGTKVSKDERKLVDQVESRLQNVAIDSNIMPLLGMKRLNIGKDFERNVDEAIILIQKWKKKYGEVV